MIGVGLSVGLFINTYPEWTAWQLAKFVVALFVGIIVGVWVNSQIFFPILYGLPKSVWLFFKGELRFVGILVQFVAPILWMTLAFIVGFVAPSFPHFVSTNLGLALGNTISVVVVLLSLVTPSGLRDLRSDFDEKTYARFRKNQQDQMEEIRSKARAWRETVNKEMETTNVLLSQCVYKFREGYG